MTYRSIITNMIEADARQRLCIELCLSGSELTFANVRMEEKKTKTVFWHFYVEFNVSGKPWKHTVYGSIDEYGRLNMFSYQLGSDSKGFRAFKY